MVGPLAFTHVLLGVLAVWRITHLLWGEDGPGDIFVRLRRRAGQGFFGRLLDCFYCLSLWFSAPFALMLGSTWFERALLWLGLSGGAILLERATSQTPSAPPPALWHTQSPTEKQKEEDPDNVLLR